MTPEAQRIAIAEACGWTSEYYQLRPTSQPYYALHKDTGTRAEEIPDYLNDLNAMHVALQTLDEQKGELKRFNHALEMSCAVSGRDHRTSASEFRYVNATAAQRAEAFLRTLNLYTE